MADGDELLPLLAVQVQRRCQLLQRTGPRTPAATPFQFGNRSGADTRTLSKRFLSEAETKPVRPEQCTKRVPHDDASLDHV
ncbi:hypothetical protein GCM10027161_00030 [Microbispora hainanensis]